MSDIVKSSLTALIAGERPSPSAIQACFTAIMDGDVGEAQMAAFLIALKMRGEQVDDIAAAASVMREQGADNSGKRRCDGYCRHWRRWVWHLQYFDS